MADDEDSHESIDKRWKLRYSKSSQTFSSSTTNGFSNSKSSLWSERYLSYFKSHVQSFLISRKHSSMPRSATLPQSTTVTTAESSGSLATADPGRPRGRDSGRFSHLNAKCQDNQPSPHQVCRLRPNKELRCKGSQEEEMPGEMPSRGTQGLGILLKKTTTFKQTQT